MASPAPTRTRSTSSAGAAPAPRASTPPPSGRPVGSCVAGRYRLDPHNAAWWWSPEMYELFGLPAEGARPSTELLLQCQHRDDRARILQAISTACAAGRPFAVETRVLRRDGTLRVVVIHGEPIPGPRGPATTVEGACLDITEGRISHDDAVVAALQTELGQLRTAMASRATIEQAKGVLMVLTSCSEQVAFELLAHMSSHTHRKVRDVATSITESAAGRAPLPDDIRGILRDACPPAPRMH
jgi:PAS domain S-box-containing protein